MGLLCDDDENDARVVPLITCTDGVYAAHEEALQYLRSVRTKVALLVIVGRYRTGKSTLINTLCGTDGAFPVGDTTNACTKGLHLRLAPLHRTDALNVLVVDTEGIGSLTADSQDHDVKILALSMLLASMLLYNSAGGAIDEQALQSLNVMTKVSALLRASAEADAEAGVAPVATTAPRFVWCLRDFSLVMQSKDGQACDAAAYLEEALADVEGDGDGSDRNAVRRTLRETFPCRHLVTFPRPAENTQYLTQRRMSRGFGAAVGALRDLVLRTIAPLRAGAHEVTGPMLAHICEAYAAALNQPDAVPSMRDSWSMLAEIHERDARDECLHEAAVRMDEVAAAARDAHVPDLDARLTSIVEAAAARYAERLMQPDAARERDLRERLTHLADERARAARRARAERAMERVRSVGDAVAAGLGLGEFVALLRAVSQAAVEDPDVSSRLLAECAHAWLPAIAQRAAQHAEDERAQLEEANARCTQLQTALDEGRRTAEADAERHARECELQIASRTAALQMQVDMRAADVEHANERRDAAEAELHELRLEVALLRTRCEEGDDAAGGADGAEGGQGGASDADEAVDAKEHDEEGDEAAGGGATLDDHDSVAARRKLIQLESEVRTLTDEARELGAIRDALSAQCAKEREQRETGEAQFQRQLQQLQQRHTERAAATRHEADEALRRARDEGAASAEREAALRDELAGVRHRCARLEAAHEEAQHARERELRVYLEAQLAGRAMCEDLQQRLLEMQQSCMSELRLREQQQRDRLAQSAADSLRVQIQCGEAQRREERALGEVRELKRRLGANDELQASSKRLRADLDDGRARMAHLEAEAIGMRSRLEEAHAERERLREAHVDAECRNAALRRELDIVRAETALG